MKYITLLFIEASSFSELVQRAEAGASGRFGPVVLAAEQLWGRLRGSNFRWTLDSCLPLDQAVYRIHTLDWSVQKGLCQDIMTLVQP